MNLLIFKLLSLTQLRIYLKVLIHCWSTVFLLLENTARIVRPKRILQLFLWVLIRIFMYLHSITTRTRMITFRNIRMSLFLGYFQNNLLAYLFISRIHNLIFTRSNVFVLSLFTKSIHCWSEKLKFTGNRLLSFNVYVIGTWPWCIILKIYHFSQLYFEGVICFVNLSFKMRFYRFGSENCWWS
jgi:hypothetical protein